MVGVVKGMYTALASMDVNKITKVMDKFEKQFEDLDVRSAYMEGAISGATAASTPEEDVDSLIQMVADEHGLAVSGEMDGAGQVSTTITAKTTPAEDVSSKENDLAARLAALHK